MSSWVLLHHSQYDSAIFTHHHQPQQQQHHTSYLPSTENKWLTRDVIGRLIVIIAVQSIRCGRCLVAATAKHFITLQLGWPKLCTYKIKHFQEYKENKIHTIWMIIHCSKSSHYICCMYCSTHSAFISSTHDKKPQNRVKPSAHRTGATQMFNRTVPAVQRTVRLNGTLHLHSDGSDWINSFRYVSNVFQLAII